MEKTKNIPKIRFKGYKDEWEKDKFKQFFKLSQGLQIPIAKRYIERVPDSYFYITNEFLDKNNDKEYYIKSPKASCFAHKDDILMTRTGNTGKVVTDVEGVFHNNFFKIAYQDNCNDKMFIYYLLSSPILQSEILRRAGTSTIPDLNHNDFLSIEGSFPSYEEQKQIGSLFKNLDGKLEIEREKYEKLVNFKKAMLENVFPKEGEKRPKIRFGGYNDDWEDYSIERLPGFKSFDKGNGLTKDDLLKNDKYNKAILYGHIFTEYGNYLNEVKFSTKKFSDKYTFSEIGDLIIPASSTTSDNSIARGLAVNIPNVIYGGDINVIRFNNDITNVFLAYYMDNNFLKNKIFEVVQGTTIHHLYLNNIKDISVSIPSINEQKLIGSFFKNLDETIQVSEEKITKIENFKKAVMEAMFV